MTWHYRCPDCGNRVQVEWSRLQEEKQCPHCHKFHFPPTPGEDHEAYVATDRVPEDMASAVISLRGTTCAVPGCFHEYTELVHKKPASKGGQTCVENLLPMCHEHAHGKGETDYDEWVSSLPKPEPEAAPFEITFTRKQPKKPETPKRVLAAAPESHPARRIRPLASHVEISSRLPPEVHLVAAAPFMPGRAHKILLYYVWTLADGDHCRVALAAWPLAEEPDWSKGLDSVSAREVINVHRLQDGDHGSAKLELPVDGAKDEPWVVGVFEEGRPTSSPPPAAPRFLKNYLLAGTD